MPFFNLIPHCPLTLKYQFDLHYNSIQITFRDDFQFEWLINLNKLFFNLYFCRWPRRAQIPHRTFVIPFHFYIPPYRTLLISLLSVRFIFPKSIPPTFCPSFSITHLSIPFPAVIPPPSIPPTILAGKKLTFFFGEKLIGQKIIHIYKKKNWPIQKRQHFLGNWMVRKRAK